MDMDPEIRLRLEKYKNPSEIIFIYNQLRKWNDTSLAHMCIRLMTKTNHPYNENLLTRDEWLDDFMYTFCYIKLLESGHPCSSTLYNFTPEYMDAFIDAIHFDKGNQMEELKPLWEKIIMEKITN